jgi:kynurenine formamidase
VPKATANACESENLIGDTRRGGSCNFEEYKLIPHCNGTHTECIGHITNQRISVFESLKDCFIPGMLISVEPERAFETDESYSFAKNATDRLITEKSIQKALKNADTNWLKCLIIRTLPNEESKKSRKYLDYIPPFFSLEAINFIVEKKINHLLVDVPSIDRLFDKGQLSAHHVFWKMQAESRQPNEESLLNNTITEMVFVPDTTKDGYYLLNLQITSFVADASPSRPVLYEVYRENDN